MDELVSVPVATGKEQEMTKMGLRTEIEHDGEKGVMKWSSSLISTTIKRNAGGEGVVVEERTTDAAEGEGQPKRIIY